MEDILQAYQELLKTPLVPPQNTWHLQLARAYTLHLDQQVQTFHKWIRGRTKAPGNRIKLLTNVELMDNTL